VSRPNLRPLLANALLVAWAFVGFVPDASATAPIRREVDSGAPGEHPAIVTRGEGPGIVILSGLLGGVARMRPLADSLVARGFRVMTIDPYRLSAESADVSFHGMAQEVARAMERIKLGSAVVVAHAHASGIALRLAANAPDRVHELVLLEGGLLPTTRSAGVTRGLRTAQVVARFPGGHAVLRTALAMGIRANSGNRLWLDDATAREYADQLLADLPAVARMVSRLAEAREPETTTSLLRRLQAPTLILVGAAPHDFTPGESELAGLAALDAVRIERVPGVGHFVHEEALPVVLRAIERAESRRRVL
jgi:pimeloyl-ACP methyl ester carboxylesterase